MNEETPTMENFHQTLGDVVTQGLNMLAAEKPEAAQHIGQLLEAREASVRVVINMAPFSVALELTQPGSDPVLICRFENQSLAH